MLAVVLDRIRIAAVLQIGSFFFKEPATTEIYTLSLHDALPISHGPRGGARPARGRAAAGSCRPSARDRKSTRLNSSHLGISYAVFCLKKKIEGESKVAQAGPAVVTDQHVGRLQFAVTALPALHA